MLSETCSIFAETRSLVLPADNELCDSLQNQPLYSMEDFQKLQNIPPGYYDMPPYSMPVSTISSFSGLFPTLLAVDVIVIVHLPVAFITPPAV